MNKRKKKDMAFILAGILLLMSFLVFNEYGIYKYLRLRKDLAGLRNQSLKADSTIHGLLKEVDSLKYSSIKIEKEAREKYQMARKGEKIIEAREQ